MKHLQKVKTVYVKAFYKNNGHFIGSYEFGCALEAKRFVENMANTSKKSLLFMVEDDYNELYTGDGKKI